MTILIPPKHISITCGHELINICTDLFALGISYFEHVRIYSGGEISWLSTNDARSKSILENEISGALKFDFSKIKAHRYLFAEDIVETIRDSSMRKLAENKIAVSKDEYDIRNLFQIIIIKDNVYEAFVFGTNEKENLFKSDYLSLINYLEYFIFYYYEKGFKLINESDKFRIKIPNMAFVSPTKNLAAPLPKVDKFYFKFNNKEKFLTNREFQVCRYLVRGYSRKETANILGIKPRTIDSILSNALARNSFFNFTHLVNKIKESDFLHLIYSGI